jgi:membrane fusion protein (multidrug efflux system)
MTQLKNKPMIFNRSTKSKITLAFALLAIIAGLAVSCKKKTQVAAPPLPVPVIDVIQREVPVYMEQVGQVYGASDITIRARVEGFLQGVHFKEGSTVTKGQLLYTIDPAPYQEQVAGQKALLAEAETMKVKADNDLKRIRPLAEVGAVSQRDLDAAIAQFGAASEQVEAAAAGVRAAEINLGYTRILSPITGVIGITQAKVGDFVGRGFDAVVLNTVSIIDSVLVRFSISEADFLDFSRRWEELAKSRLDEKYQGLHLILADGSDYPHKGRADVINRQVDPMTGTIQLQAVFQNPDRFLRPGQFARVRGVIEVKKDALLIPQRAVTELQGIFNVFVIGAENKVKVVPLKVGPTIGNLYVVEQGLAPGDQVIVEGLQKVRPQMAVVPTKMDFSLTEDFKFMLNK